MASSRPVRNEQRKPAPSETEPFQEGGSRNHGDSKHEYEYAEFGGENQEPLK